MTLKIVDISSYQPNYVFGSNGEDGYIVKATQGTGYINPYFTAMAAQAQSKGFPWGVYHYATGGDAVAEATYFVNTVKPYLTGDNQPLLFLDWESGDNAAWGNGSWANVFISTVKSQAGKQSGLYTGGDGVQQTQQYLANQAPLWFAGYPRTNVGWSPLSFPYNIGSWNELTGWQFDDEPIDKSLFYLGKDEWHALAGNAQTQSAMSATKGQIEMYLVNTIDNTTKASLHWYTVGPEGARYIHTPRVLGFMKDKLGLPVDTMYQAEFDKEFGNVPLEPSLQGAAVPPAQPVSKN